MITRGGCFTRTILCLRFFDFVVLSCEKKKKRKKEGRKEEQGGLLTRVLRKEKEC